MTGRIARTWPRLVRPVAEMAGVLLPARCVGCGERIPPEGSDPLVCSRCRGLMRPPTPPLCRRCHFPLGSRRALEPDCLACREWPEVLVAARWAVSLEAPSDALVHGLKYEGWKALAGTMAGRMAALEVPGEAAREPLVVPVPTSPRRERQRGYNQAGLLAEGYAELRGLRTSAALVRRRGGGSQVALHPDERRLNVSSAFDLAPSPTAALAGRDVVLVDDVLTTGATAAAAALTLERGGARGVTLLTFARSLPARV